MDAIDVGVAEERRFITACSDIPDLIDRMAEYRDQRREAVVAGATKLRLRIDDLLELAEERISDLKAKALSRRRASPAQPGVPDGATPSGPVGCTDGPTANDVGRLRQQLHSKRAARRREELRRAEAEAETARAEARRREDARQREEARARAARSVLRPSARPSRQAEARASAPAATPWPGPGAGLAVAGSSRQAGPRPPCMTAIGNGNDCRPRQPGAPAATESAGRNDQATTPSSPGRTLTTPATTNLQIAPSSPAPVDYAADPLFADLFAATPPPSPHPRQYTGSDLAAYRASRGLTQRIAAVHFGVAPGTIAKAELAADRPLGELLQAGMRNVLEVG